MALVGVELETLVLEPDALTRLCLVVKQLLNKFSLSSGERLLS